MLKITKREEKQTRMLVGTLVYGVIVNFILLVYLDSGTPDEDPYRFILVISIILGYAISAIVERQHGRHKQS